MNYKMICTDIDGTLLNKERELSKKTIEQIKRVKNTVPVILISSRMPKAMRHLQEELDILNQPLIAYNGGLIMDTNGVIESTEIDNKIIKQIISFTKNTEVHISLYNNDDWLVPQMDYWAKREMNNTKVTPTVQDLNTTLANWNLKKIGAHKIMCMGAENEIELLYNHLEKLHYNDIILYRSKPTYIEIAHRNISKETAINRLITENFSQITMKDIIAFGDNYNDIEMLKAVGMGVVVENANKTVKNVADYHTESNINDGVALAIEKFFVK